MHEHLGFLRVTSTMVKVAAWCFLFFGVIGGSSILLGLVPEYSPGKGIIVFLVFGLLYCFLYILARISDLLIKIIQAIGVPKENSSST